MVLAFFIVCVIICATCYTDATICNDVMSWQVAISIRMLGIMNNVLSNKKTIQTPISSSLSSSSSSSWLSHQNSPCRHLSILVGVISLRLLLIHLCGHPCLLLPPHPSLLSSPSPPPHSDLLTRTGLFVVRLCCCPPPPPHHHHWLCQHHQY